MNCNHPEILVTPGTIIPDGDGFIVTDLEKGSMYCPKCETELPIEDLYYYPKEQLNIAIPQNMVDPPIVSDPAP